MTIPADPTEAPAGFRMVNMSKKPTKLASATERKLLERSWRGIADEFKLLANDAEAGTAEQTRADRVAVIHLQERAAGLLCQTWNQGWLRDIEGLSEWIRWLEGGPNPDGVPEPPNGQAKFLRCPVNVLITLVSELLPAQFPGCFSNAPFLRELTKPNPTHEVERFQQLDAAADFKKQSNACHLIADLISAKQNPARPDDKKIDLLTREEKRLWDALDGRAMSATDLAGEFSRTPETVRKTKHRLNQRPGFSIENVKGRGYYRPDAPPTGLGGRST